MKTKYICMGMLALGLASCSDNFLDEKMVSVITQDYFETEQGVDQLVVSTYNAERLRYGFNEGPYLFEQGHDCGVVCNNTELNRFSTSAYTSTGPWNSIAGYVNTFMGTQSKQQSGFIINAYPVIDCCNKAIGLIRENKVGGKYASDPSYAAQKLSEALFNRAYALYSLNTLLGDIYVPTQSLTSLPSNFNYKREPSEQLWRMIISDLRYAYENLPEKYSDAEFGHITKGAAAHFLARLYLERAQAAQYGTTEYGRQADGSIDNSNPKSYLGMLYKGNVSTDLDSCIYFASQVINSGVYQLQDNYADLFHAGVGDWSNEGSKEIILPALFGNGTDNYRYGQRMISYFGSNYVNVSWGIPNYTWECDAPVSGTFMNNDWGYDVFTDKINDTRYQGSFAVERTTRLRGGGTASPGADMDYYAYNDPKNETYTWTASQAKYFNDNILPTYKRASWGGRQAVAGEHKMGAGDIAFAFIENTKATAIDVDEADAQPFVCFARWMKKGNKYYYRPVLVGQGKSYSFVDANSNSTNHYGLEQLAAKEGKTSTITIGQPGSSKYIDPNRASYTSIYATRDVPIFRFAETYLLRAEAEGRKGDYQSAINDINVLRRRAAFKAGQQRDEVIARLYPGHEQLTNAEQEYPYAATGDSYDKIKVDASYWDGASEKSRLENYPPTANTDAKRFQEFILNEYSREFSQEFIYYEVLHHSGLQAERIQWHDQLASNPNNTTYKSNTWDTSDNTTSTSGQDGKAKGFFENYMTLKPFPKTFLDLLTDEQGNALSEDAKKAYQNYGY